MLTRTIRCADCRVELPERENVGRERRSPCPQCGSLNRLLEVETTGHAQPGGRVRVASLSDDPRLRPQWVAEATAAADRFDRTQSVKVIRRFDLDRGIYSEHVERVDDGSVVRQVEQTLEEHARKKPST
jgi:phage FluMu protein Com